MEKTFPEIGELIQVSVLCSALTYTSRNSGISEVCTTPSGWIKIGKQTTKLLEAGEKKKETVIPGCVIFISGNESLLGRKQISGL